MAFTSLKPLRSRNFALVWSSALISNVGTWMQTVALGTLITLHTHNPLWTALVLAAGFLPMGVLAPVGGVLADRLDRRRWLIITTIAEAAVATVLTVMVATHNDPPGALVIMSALGGAAGAIGFPSYQSMLPDLVDRDDLLAAVSLSSAQWNMGRVIGPALAGIVIVVWSPAAAFGCNAISFLAVVIALSMVRLPVRTPVAGPMSIWARLVDGAKIAAAEPACRAAITLISIVAFVGSPFIGLIAAVAIVGLHVKAGGPAVLTTAQGIGAVIGALALAPLAKRFGQRPVVISALVGLCVALIIYGLAPTLGFAAVGILLVGAAYICVLSGLNTVVQMRAPEHARGRVLSIYMTALGTIYPIGLIVEGAIGQVIGIRLMTVLSGVVLALALGAVAILRPVTFSSLRAATSDSHLDVTTPEVAEVDLGARSDD